MCKISSFWVFVLVFLAVSLFSLSLAGCVAAPVQEMSDARQAIQAARDFTGSPHLNDDLLKAQRMLQDAESALAEGEYNKARMSAQAARKYALQAQKVARIVE